jgi:signal recognition particle GTPase
MAPGTPTKFKGHAKHVLPVACDVYRPAAVEQLKLLADSRADRQMRICIFRFFERQKLGVKLREIPSTFMYDSLIRTCERI